MYIRKKASPHPDIKEFIIGAAIIIATFVVLLVFGYFENNLFYVGVTVILIVIALVVAYFIGYHRYEPPKKPITGKIS